MTSSLRYATWLDRHRRAILIASLAVAAAAGVLAAKLPVRGDFSYLLPSSARSVQELRALEARVPNLGTLTVVVQSKDPRLRAAAADFLHERALALSHELVSLVIFDDSAARKFVWDHRFLYANRADLAAARDALADKIRQAKLKANPLYVDLEDEAAGDEATGKLDKLQEKLDKAERERVQHGRVSKDGRMQLIVIRTAFEAGTASKGAALVAAVRREAREVERRFRGVEVGITGDVMSGLAEHDALIAGMLRAAVLTVLFVAAGLLLFYRSLPAIGALLWSLTVGTLVTFGFTKLAIGNLNLASAFLSSIVVGNGINFGIVVVARHLEERRRGGRGVQAIATALGGTLKGTLAAALTAAVAYGSLAATNFRGFKHFGIIGGAGMIFCWLSAYSVLPAALAVLERRALAVRREPALGRLLAHLLPDGPRATHAVILGVFSVTAAAAVATAIYLQNPYEGNWRNLRSSGKQIEAERRLLSRISDEFGHVSGGFIVLAPTRQAERIMVDRLRAVDAGKPREQRLLANVRSMDDALPAEQPAKLAILTELRRMIDHESQNLGDADRDRLAKLRPPDDLRPIADADLPEDMARPFTTRDGQRGLIAFGDAAGRYDTWLTRDLLDYTARVSQLDLGPGVVLGGANFVFADVIRAMSGDGPRASVIALVGVVLVIFLLQRVSRHAAITLACMGSGTLLMLAGAWLMGLRVNFLDFVALPITMGIGVDYSVNIVARARQDDGGGRAALATTGGAVALCSFTTVVGYGSLLLSANQGIRSFGHAAILGELTCIASALVLAPALLQLLARRAARRRARSAATLVEC